jgi:hypothetical protein
MFVTHRSYVVKNVETCTGEQDTFIKILIVLFCVIILRDFLSIKPKQELQKCYHKPNISYKAKKAV